MIISHKHRFIFLHSRKVAGSTITTLCNRHLGPDDIQTGVWNDTIAAGGRYNRWALRVAHRTPWALLRGSAGYALRGRRLRYNPGTVNRLIQTYLADRAGLPGGAHPTAAAVRAFDPEAWRDYTKFCFVRNPWDHAVSDYYWRASVRRCTHVGFTEYMRRLADPARPDPEGLMPPLRSNWDIYAIDGRVEADIVGRFETLGADLATVGARLGITLDPDTVPRAKGAVRGKARPGDARHTAETIELVRTVYAREIAAFGYTPPVPAPEAPEAPQASQAPQNPRDPASKLRQHAVSTSRQGDF